MFLFMSCFSERLVPLLVQHKIGWKISIDGRDRLTETATTTLANEAQLDSVCSTSWIRLFVLMNARNTERDCSWTGAIWTK